MWRFLLLAAVLMLSPARAEELAVSRALTVEGKSRSYLVFVPTGATQAPLVITLHGHGQSARGMEAMSGWNKVAALEGAVAVYPLARGGRWRIFGADSEDVAFLRTLIDTLAAEGVVDPRRVFINGYSGGAQMSWRFACEAPTRVVAAGFVAGAAPNGCGLGAKPPVLMFHGLMDRSLPFEKRRDTLAIPRLGQAWAARQNCDPAEAVEALEAPAQRDDGVRRHVWVCDPAAPVQLLSFKRGGHDWPGHSASLGARSVDATQEMWRFFQAHDPHRP
jgi:polyhydroxybutyrate depolymerase